MENLEKKIKKENRKIVLKKVTDKLLAPARLIGMYLGNSKKSLCSDLSEYIEKKRQVKETARKEREEERKFQSSCQDRYEKYLKTYNPKRVGDMESIEERIPFDNAVKSGIPCFVNEILFFTDMGCIVDTHSVYPYDRSTPSLPFSKTELEGIVKDNDKYVYVIATDEKFSFAGNSKYSAIKRKPNGKFVKCEGIEGENLYFTLNNERLKCERDYRASHLENQM